MGLPSVDLVEKVREAGEAIDGWPAGEGVRRRAEATAALLHSLWPGTILAACVLGRGEEAVVSVLDETGGRRPEWEPAIRDEGLRPMAERTAAPPALNLAGRALAWEDVRFRDRIHGALALVVPEGEGAGRETAPGFLAVMGRLLAGRLEIDALERERAGLADAAASDAGLAEVGEASAPLAHEFNNFLNALLLHIAVLQIKLPSESRIGLEEVRRQAMDVAGLIQQFQNYRRRTPAPPGPTVLNRVVRTAAALAGAAIRLDLADGELSVVAPYADLKRLCLLLLRNAVGAAAATGGDVAARTARSGGRIVLRVEDGGPPLSPEAAARLFEPSAPARDGVNSLEMAVCRTLVRRMQGAVRGEPRPEGGAAVIVEWDDPKVALRR